MLHCHKIRRIVRPRVIIPAHDVQIFGQCKLIQFFDIAGHVGLNGDFGIVFFQHLVLIHKTLCGGVGDKAHIIQLDSRIETIIII